MAPPARTITVALDMNKAFDTINIHSLIRKLLQTNIPDTIIKLITNNIIETTHPDNINLKLVFHKVASFHPHHLTFALQTYLHPVHRFRSWPTQTTSPSHPHTHARVQPRNTYNHTYVKFLPGQNKTTSIIAPTQTHNILNYSKTKTLFSTMDATQQTFPQTPTQSLQQTYKQTCAIYIHLLSLGI